MLKRKGVKIILLIVISIVMIGIFKNLFAQKNSEQLKEIVENGAFLVDVRTPAEFKQGTAKGAVNIPLDSIEHQLSKFRGKNHIVVFCRSGNRSEQAKKKLEKNGFENVVNGGTWNQVSQIVSETK